MPKLFKSKLFFQAMLAALVATLATAGIVGAATTIGSNISTAGNLSVTSTTATSTFSTGGLTIGTSQFVVQQTSGNVGIGTTSPYAKLSVVGPVIAEYFHATSSTATTTIAGDFVVASGGSGNNRILIGTTTPDSISSGNNVGLFFDYSTLGGSSVYFTNKNGSAVNTASGQYPAFFINNFNSFTGFYLKKVASGAGDYVAVETSTGGSLFNIKSSGNIGIGTTSPFTLLGVAGTITANNINATSTTATSTFSGGLSVGNNAAFVVNQAAAANSLYINSSGNVGIGTTTPNNKLDIYSTTKSAIGFSGASGSNYKWTIGMDVSNGGRFSIASSSALGTLDRLVIDGAGNVSVGGWATTTAAGVVGPGRYPAGSSPTCTANEEGGFLWNSTTKKTCVCTGASWIEATSTNATACF